MVNINMALRTTVLLLCFIITSCSTSIEHYKNKTPSLDLEAFFQDRMIANGVIFDRKGALSRHFCVEIDSQWQPISSKDLDIKYASKIEGQALSKGKLFEKFYFDDGETQIRNWEIIKSKKDATTYYAGSAGDVVGVAKGKTEGNTLQWQYTLTIPLNAQSDNEKNINLLIEDWIYTLDESMAFNRSKIKKYGLTVGEIFIYFYKEKKICQSGDNLG